MYIKRSPSFPPRNILFLLGVLLLVALVAAYGYKTLVNTPAKPSETINYDEPTDQQIKAGEQTKKSTIDQEQASNTNNGSSDPKLQQPTEAATLETNITAASVEDGVLYIRNNINGIYQDGTCTLTLTNSGKVIKKTADIQPLPKSSTCKGFNVNISELSSGTWKIEITVTTNDGSATANATIKV